MKAKNENGTMVILANQEKFAIYFDFGGVETNRRLFLDLSTNSEFNELFIDCAWISGGKVVRHNDLDDFMIACIDAAAAKLSLAVDVLN